MNKLTAWIVLIIGILLALPIVGVTALDAIAEYLVPLGVLVIGIGGIIGKL